MLKTGLNQQKPLCQKHENAPTCLGNFPSEAEGPSHSRGLHSSSLLPPLLIPCVTGLAVNISKISLCLHLQRLRWKNVKR